MSSSKSTVSFNNSVGSQRLHRVDEDMDSMEFVSGDVSMKLARVKDQYASLGNKQRRLTEKEERFKNKYRWAEKRHTLRTGKCEGYSFFSIKGGLRKQDFRDTINWSPINAAKEEGPHLSDVVKQLLKNQAPIQETVESTFISQEEEEEVNDQDWAAQPAGSNRMSENDWQLARSRKLDPLRNRGSNKLSVHMNLDSFIDSALSEQIKENNKLDAPIDMSLGELQSPKLIESRFGWSKVRRAVASTTPIPSSSSVSSKMAGIVAAASASQKISSSVVSNPASVILSAGPSMASISTGGLEPSEVLNEPSFTESPNTTNNAGGSVMSASSYDQDKEQYQDLAEGSVNNTIGTARSAGSASSLVPVSGTLPRPATAGASKTTTSFCFSVPESAIHLRPRSAVLSPVKGGGTGGSMVTPVNEFVQIVRQESGRPKSSSGISDSSSRSVSNPRPKTATLRIAPAPPISPQHQQPISERELIAAMLNWGNLESNTPTSGAKEPYYEDQSIEKNYRGLIYHDPSTRKIWQGVSDLLAAPPVLGDSVSHMRPGTAPDTRAAAARRSDMRWAGKTLNCYRPWSPIRHSSPPLHLAPLNTETAALTAVNSAQNSGNPLTVTSSRMNSARLTNRTDSPTPRREVIMSSRGEATPGSSTIGDDPLTIGSAAATTSAPASARAADGSPRRGLIRPSSEQVDSYFPGALPTEEESGQEVSPRRYARHASSPAVSPVGPSPRRQSSSPRGAGIFSATATPARPSVSPRHTIAATATTTSKAVSDRDLGCTISSAEGGSSLELPATTMRPFSARPKSSTRSSTARPHSAVPHTLHRHSMGDIQSSGSGGGVRGGSLTTTPRQKGVTSGTAGMQQNSSIFSSSQLHTSRSSIGRRAPLLINIVSKSADPALAQSPPKKRK